MNEEKRELIAPNNNNRFIAISSTMQSWRMQKVDLRNPRKTAARVKKYIEWCQDNDKDPNPIGLANWLGVSRQQMNEWKSGKFGNLPGEEVIQKAFMYLEEMWYSDFMQNKAMPTAYIFMGKNWFNYKDSQDIQITPNQPLGAEQTEEELRKRISADVVIDDAAEQPPVKRGRGRPRKNPFA